MRKRPFGQPIRLVSSKGKDWTHSNNPTPINNCLETYKGATVSREPMTPPFPTPPDGTPRSYPTVPLTAILGWIVWLSSWMILGSLGMIMWSVFFYNILFGN